MPHTKKYFRVAMPAKVFDLNFEIPDVESLVKFWGKTFRPARKAPNISGRISGQISANVSETSFQVSRPFSETSFSRRAV